MARLRELTELEGGVLGLIKERRSCTPYAIRRVFLKSPTPHWSGSAGAIYPLIRRLSRMGLIRPVRAARDKRGRTLYALTATGERAFAQWLGPPFSRLTIGVPPDPMRTRINLLRLLAPSERRAFLAEATTGFQAHLAELTSALTGEADPFERLALRGAQLAMQARATWVGELVEALSSSGAATL
ncbi:MAG TPA: PadR family transcriptional regulator [Planctomycetaceae bacterium]|nr:PadR family transcriptional regulator [Planctomycetaceae bacterium]